MVGCCGGGKKKNEEYDPQFRENEAPECMPHVPPDELCPEELREEFRMKFACGVYLTRKVLFKSPDDVILDVFCAMDDLLDFWEECADDPLYYKDGVFQSPCDETIIRERMNKECRKKVACAPICLPERRAPQ
ncbi:hypothetical protein HHI36_019087 [Cryptolaemus montrouzieri]|uniref:Uncharacterized protein n=1 Tax=Cryptolaemus montrouzieri TaxID=559131 RepID=A0ABD2P267_9CUCU